MWHLLLFLVVTLLHLESVSAGPSIVTFNENGNNLLLASSESVSTIIVDENDWCGVQRAARDLALDFGRVTGLNGSMVSTYGNVSTATTTIIAGTIGRSTIITDLIASNKLDVTAVENQWEAYQVQLLPDTSRGPALVIAGADKRGTIYGLYEISGQIGVSPWYWWADVGVIQQDKIYAMNTTVIQKSPSVKYRGIFINDEQPGLSNWIQANYPDLKYGAGFNHVFYSTLFELLLRLKANYIWPAMWGSMFYVDDAQNAKTADDYGLVMGTSHTEPMARATNEQGNEEFIQGPWSWDTNRDNVTEFMREGAVRAQPYETLFTMGMRGHGDVASPTLNATSLEQIVGTQQQLLRDVYNTTNLSGIPQMWCLYKEVAQYYADGLEVPDDVTLLWAEDNWGNAYRLSYGNETSRSGGSGIYYHVDYVGDPRDYKWINTISLQKSWSELQQAYARGAQRIWILNVGDLKALELPTHHFLDMAYEIDTWNSPNSTSQWLKKWSSRNFGADVADSVTQILTNYSMYAARRKYELLDPNTYSLVNYDEADTVLSQWSTLKNAAQQVHDSLPVSLQPGFFEMVLHPCTAGYIIHQIHINAAKNNLYSQQGRTSTNVLSQQVIDSFNADFDLTQQYHSLLDGKWNHVLSQTHLGYQYWQQPMRNAIPPLSYVQTREVSLAGALGVTCEGNNGSVPGDDMYHSLSSNVLTLPPMDPYGPTTRWIEIFSRGPINFPVSWNVSIDNPAVTTSQSSGTLSANGSISSLDVRLYVSVNWDLVTTRQSQATINVTTTSPSSSPDHYVNATNHPYGNFGMPQIQLPLNKTTVPPDILAQLPPETFVESDGFVSIEAEHFTSISDNSTTTTSEPRQQEQREQQAYLTIIPSYGRTLSGLTLQPYLIPSPPTPDASSNTTTPISVPYVTYTFATTTQNLTHINTTIIMGPSLNTNPDRPLRYAVDITPLTLPSTNSSSSTTTTNTTQGQAETIQTVFPVPPSDPGTLPDAGGFWTDMVSDAVMSNTTLHDVTGFLNINDNGDDDGGGVRVWTLRLWILEPGLVVQRVLIEVGTEAYTGGGGSAGAGGLLGVRRTYLGPPESFRLS